MKIIFLGCTRFSEIILESLIQTSSLEIRTIFTIPEYFSISYSEKKVKNTNYSDLSRIAKRENIPCFEVNSVQGKRLQDYYGLIESIEPNIILVMGWYFMVPKRIRNLAKSRSIAF